MQVNRPFLIGLTGNIGSGKSTVASILADSDIFLIKADDVSHAAFDDPAIISKINETWGSQVFSDSKIDRRKLGRLVFDDQDQLSLLNSIIHPWTLQRLDELVRGCDLPYCCIEVPLLFEFDLDDCFDLVLLVIGTRELNIKRVVERDRIDTDTAILRIEKQIYPSKAMNRADYIIENLTSLSTLRGSVVEFLRILPEMPHREVTPFSDHII